MNRSIYNKITIKFFMYFVFMTFFIFLFPENVAARDYHVPDGILTNYFGSGGDITLPDDVQKVGVSVFKDNKDITSVVIPEGCFAIEDGAFEGCSNLRTISLPSTLDSIGLLAFHDCTSLEYIILPRGLTTLGRGAFSGCTSLGAITIPANVTEIGFDCFCKCARLSRLEVEQGNRNYVAENDILYTSDRKTLIQYPIGKQDTSFSVPHGVEIIADRSFEKARYLREITFSDTVKEICPYAFSGCIGLTCVNFPANIEKIREFSFRNCSNLNQAFIHGKDTGIVVKAYEGDTSLILYVPEDSRAKTHARKYNIRFRILDDDTYDYPEPDIKF